MYLFFYDICGFGSCWMMNPLWLMIMSYFKEKPLQNAEIHNFTLERAYFIVTEVVLNPVVPDIW